MSEPMTDDDLRSMLEARSGRVPPGADREVLRAARAAIAGPAAREAAAVSFPIRRVEAVRRPSRMPWAAGAVAVAAIVAVAVVGSRLPLDVPRATTGLAGSPGAVAGVGDSAVPTAGGAPGSFLPDASGGIATGATALTIVELGNRLRTGELDGKTVIVAGRASLAPGRCRYEASPDPTHDCIFMHLEGLPDQFINKGDRTAEQVQADIDTYGSTTPMVLLGVDRGLRLVGWLVAGADRPLPPDGPALLRRGLQDDVLVAVSGWLQVDGVEQITETQKPDPAGGLIVDILPSVMPGPGAPAEGTFILKPDLRTNRLSDIIRWQVVANLSSSSTVYVTRPSSSLAAPTIASTELIAALADGSLDGQVLAIDGELKSVAWDCPLDAAPCSRFYVDGLPGVAITWYGALLGSDGSGGGATSTMSGRLLVTPRHGRLQPQQGYLELLGVLDGGLDRPAELADLGDVPSFATVPDPLQVQPVDGWLVANGPVSCPMIRVGQDPAVVCPLGQPFLSPSEPDASAKPTDAGNVPVSFRPAAPGVGPTPVREAGPFLVGARAGGWMVVARYDPGTVRLVTVP